MLACSQGGVLDLGPTVIDEACMSGYCQLFYPKQFIAGKESVAMTTPIETTPLARNSLMSS